MHVMKKLLTLGALAAIAAVAVPGSGAATGSVGEVLKPFCTTGTFRCMSALRVDVPVVPHATASHDGMGPADLRAAYRLASAAVTNGTGQTVALVDAYDDPTIESDLATYRAYYGLPPCTTANGCFKKVNQDGEQGNYPIVANPSWEPEIALDTEMVSAICPNCHILLVEANSADETVATSAPRSTRPSTSARPRSRTAMAARGPSPTRRSSTTTTTIPALRSRLPPETRTTGRSGRRRHRS
jgi:hypothetical protein